MIDIRKIAGPEKHVLFADDDHASGKAIKLIYDSQKPNQVRLVNLNGDYTDVIDKRDLKNMKLALDYMIEHWGVRL